jgi:Tfp pilus assembly protein PilF
MQFAGIAKLQFGDDIAAVVWLRRSIERNRNHPPSHFALAAALGLQGMLEEAQAAAKAAPSIS